MIPDPARSPSSCAAGPLALALLLGLTAVCAQGVSAPAARPDPLNPQARVPPTVYVSPLAGYRRLGEDRPVPWKEANETVNRIGGWRAYAREAQQPDPPAPARPASAPHRH